MSESGIMMTMAQEIADAVSEYASSEVSLAPSFDLGEHETAKIFVVPAGMEITAEGRKWPCPVYLYDVGLVKWLSGYDDLTATAETLESIVTELCGKTLTSGAVTAVEVTLLYSPEAYSRKKQFFGTARVTARAF